MFFKDDLLFAPTYLTCFEDGDGDGGGDGGDGDGDGGDGGGGDGDGGKKFSQEDLNHVLAEEKRKTQIRQREMAAELETIKKTATLTEEEKTSLETRIEELQSQYMTSEERARRAAEEADKKSSDLVETLTTERDSWKKQHSTLVIDGAIAKASNAHKAISDEQIGAILTTKTKLVDVLDSDGNSTGALDARVAFPDRTKENTPIVLELTVDEAVKRMKELPQYANLFEGDKASGLGGSGNIGNAKKVDIVKLAKTDQAAYRKLRREKPELFE